MKVALDLDMTLNTMAYTWMAWINQNIDPRMTLQQVKYFGYLRDAYGKEVDTYWKDPTAYDEIFPLVGAIDFVARLWVNHDVFILTHTPEGQSSQVKDAWIKEYFGNIPIIHSGQKHHHTRDCVLIDDHPGHIQRHVRHNPGNAGIIFNHHGLYGWAQPLLPTEHVYVANEFAHAIKIIEELKL